MSENLHVKVEYAELYSSKKDILMLEASILRNIQNLKKYKELRLLELRKKTSLLQKLKTLRNNFTKLKQVLPKVEQPKVKEPSLPILQKKKTKDKETTKIESELEEIQRKLGQLSQ